MKIFIITAYVTAAIWILGAVFVAVTIRTIDGVAGRWFLEMATISVFGLAAISILERILKRHEVN